MNLDDDENVPLKVGEDTRDEKLGNGILPNKDISSPEELLAEGKQLLNKGKEQIMNEINKQKDEILNEGKKLMDEQIGNLKNTAMESVNKIKGDIMGGINDMSNIEN